MLWKQKKRITNSSAFDESVFLLQFREEEEVLVAELALGFLGSVKLGEEGLRGYGKAHAVVDGFLDVTVDFWRKIHC